MLMHSIARIMLFLNLFLAWNAPSKGQDRQWEQLVAWGSQNVERKDYENAERQLLSAVAITMQFPPEDVRRAVSLTHLAELYRIQGQAKRAAEILREALNAMIKARGPDHQEVAPILNNLSVALASAGIRDGVEENYLHAIRIIESAGPNSDAMLVGILVNLGVLYNEQGRFADAERVLRKPIAKLEQTKSRDVEILSRALNNLGVALSSQRQYSEAIKCLKKALAIAGIREGENPAALGITLANIGAYYYELKQYLRAQEYFERALDKIGGANGEEENLEVATIYANIAECRFGMKDYVFAEALAQKALQMFMAQERKLTLRGASCEQTLAMIYTKQKRYEEAEPMFREAIALEEEILGPESPQVARGLSGLAYLMLKTQRKEQGLLLSARAESITSKIERSRSATIDVQVLSTMKEKRSR
jgi:tetratricopeptide (TPR) repeat protein